MHTLNEEEDTGIQGEATRLAIEQLSHIHGETWTAITAELMKAQEIVGLIRDGMPSNARVKRDREVHAAIDGALDFLMGAVLWASPDTWASEEEE